MSSWKERIRRAFETRDVKEQLANKVNIQRSEEDQRRQQESSAKAQQELIAARAIFKGVRPDLVLGMVKNDVWGGVGTVTTSEDTSSGKVHAKLEYKRDGFSREQKYLLSEEVKYGPDVHGYYYDRFEIYATANVLILSYYNGFQDLESGPHGQGISNQSKDESGCVGLWGDNNYSKAREALEGEVMKICEPKIINRTWPFGK